MFKSNKFLRLSKHIHFMSTRPSVNLWLLVCTFWDLLCQLKKSKQTSKRLQLSRIDLSQLLSHISKFFMDLRTFINFIRGFSMIMAPIINCLKAHQFQCTQEQQNSFQTIKSAVRSIWYWLFPILINHFRWILMPLLLKSGLFFSRRGIRLSSLVKSLTQIEKVAVYD